MSKQQCLLELTEILGEEALSKSEKKQLADRIDFLINKYDRPGFTKPLDTLVREHILRDMENAKQVAILSERNAGINYAKRDKLRKYLDNIWGDDPAEGLKAILGDSLVDRQGSKSGLIHKIASRRDDAIARFSSSLSKGGVLDTIATGKLDEHLVKALIETTRSAPDEAALRALDPTAVKAAKIITDHLELARTSANKAGAAIGKIDGWGMPQTHDMQAIANAAGVLVTDKKAHSDAWVNFVTERLDMEKTLSDVPDDQKRKILQNMFEQFSNGYHVKFGESKSTGLQGFGNVGKGLSHERVLHFKDAQASYEYFQKFGRGNVLENVANHLNRMYRDTAIMEEMGPNAFSNLERVVKEKMADLTEAQEGAKSTALEKRFKSIQNNVIPKITGELSIPESITLAKNSQAIRSTLQMGTLPASVLSQLPDIVTAGLNARYFGERNFSSFFKGMFDHTKTLFDTFRKLPKEEIERMADMQSVAMGSLARIHENVEVGDLPGKLSSALKTMFRYNGMEFWANGSRRAATEMLARQVESLSLKPLSELPSGFSSGLRQFDISEPEWNIWRKGDAHFGADGSNSKGIHAVRETALEAFDSIPEVAARIEEAKAAHGEKAQVYIDAAREKAKLALENKVRTMFHKYTALATAEASDVERAMLLAGTKSGSWPGEAIRHGLLLKSFTTSMTRNVVGRELLGYGAERISSKKAIWNVVKDLVMMKGGSGAGGIANLLVFGSLAGYASMNLKRIARGQKPLLPETKEEAVKTGLASLAQSGGLGIYGDFVFGDALKNRYGHSPLGTLVGPTFGAGEDLANLIQKTRESITKGESPDVGSTLLNMGLRYTPGVNALAGHPLTAPILNYSIIYRMQETMNPGFLRRMERRQKKENQREFLVPPSSVIPYGGGF